VKERERRVERKRGVKCVPVGVAFTGHYIGKGGAVMIQARLP
jgi:hypothetical protein